LDERDTVNPAQEYPISSAGNQPAGIHNVSSNNASWMSRASVK
jgi:hypothetical protein